MANDPLPLPDMAAEPPTDNAMGGHDLHRADGALDAQCAEHEAICAEIAATERGRWFLSEHIKRNRAADTNRLVGSLARAEAAMRGDAAAERAGALADDLGKLAAAIGQVEAVMAAGAPSAAEGLAASERIQDVAFALREREIDPAHCVTRWKVRCSNSGTHSRGKTQRQNARRAPRRCCAASKSTSTR
jgi:hypothetical protein